VIFTQKIHGGHKGTLVSVIPNHDTNGTTYGLIDFNKYIKDTLNDRAFDNKTFNL